MSGVSWAGDVLCEHLMVRHDFGLGARAATELGRLVMMRSIDGDVELRGRDAVTGIPRTIRVSADELRRALRQ